MANTPSKHSGKKLATKAVRLAGPKPFHLLNRKTYPDPTRGAAKIKDYLSRIHSWSR
ncbi:MAG: hypothetical protein WAP74_01530 [Patescibacteria group bacterium]